ncbi:MAG TPA: hypothetical protein VK184_22985 [Nostocaceae cyanobacterium]|nr:hypothetical protein [Nostocaceae cyanobacterium]
MLVKVINLDAPYSWVFGRYKFYDTRDRRMNHRGITAIYATKKIDDSAYQKLADFDLPVPPKEELVLGAIVAIASLTDCILMTDEFISEQSAAEIQCGIWRKGRYALKFEDIQLLETPITVTGVKPGQWNLEDVLKVGGVVGKLTRIKLKL